jgi:hypothetical protein
VDYRSCGLQKLRARREAPDGGSAPELYALRGAKSRAMPSVRVPIAGSKKKNFFFSEGISVSHLLSPERRAQARPAPPRDSGTGSRLGVAPREPQGSSDHRAHRAVRRGALFSAHLELSDKLLGLRNALPRETEPHLFFEALILVSHKSDSARTVFRSCLGLSDKLLYL